MNAFITLSEVNPPLFVEAIEHYLETGEQLNLHATQIIHRLLTLLDKKRAYQILSNHSYPTKQKWIFGYYQMLSSDQIDSTDLVELLSLYKESNPLDLPYHLDYLLRYHKFDKNIVANIISLILEKGDEVYCPQILAFLINPHSDVNKNLLDLFADHITLLKDAYFFVLQRGKHDDYNSSTLLKILEVDPNFIDEYFNHMYSPRDVKSMWDYRDPDFSVLWLQKNYEEIINKITLSIYAREESHYYTDLRKFFSPRGDDAKNQIVLSRQDEYLQKAIKARCDDSEFVAYLFDVISDFSASRKIKLLSSFLDCNKKIDDFRKLQIEPKAKSWSGSQVPVIQEEIDFYDSVLSLLNSIELLPHRNYIEQRISGLKKHLKSTIKQEFIGDE